MASQNALTRHPYYTALIAAILLVGLGLLVRSVLQSTVFQQHAALEQFNAISVTGVVYVDTNRNGKKDAGEPNYTGGPTAHVKLALFQNSCGPTPTPSTGPIPPQGSPTPGAGCYYRQFCPMGLLCGTGSKPWCPPCQTKLVCPPSSSTTPIPPQGSGVGTGSQSGGSVTIVPQQVKGVAIAQNTQPTTTSNDASTTQKEDLCNRLPLKVVTCPVAPDGTYTCTVTNTQFSEAWIRLYEPARFIITSPNPVAIKAPAATVDFGIATFFQPVGASR